MEQNQALVWEYKIELAQWETGEKYLFQTAGFLFQEILNAILLLS